MFRQLIADLHNQPPAARSGSEMATLLARHAERWRQETPLLFRPDEYTRTCAYRDNRFEILLLNWAPGAASPVHDHGDQHCWMFVLDGRLQVDDYVRLDAGDVPGLARVEPRGSQTIGAGRMDLRSGPFDLHRVSATREARAVSLHVYAGPLRRYLVYDEAAERCETVVGSYDEVLAPYAPAPRR